MTSVGMVGLGKLGLPVAYAMASRGLNVYGHDPAVTSPPEDTSHEQGLADVIQDAGERMRFCSINTVVEHCDVVFLAVQTPHEPEFEGVTPLPEERADFDYRYLVSACRQVSDEADRQEREITLAVISTVLPGTMRRYVIPALSDRVALVYTPSFIAMGTTVRDFLDPEFVLLGGDDNRHVESLLEHVYGRVDKPRHVRTAVENAELIKVAYNTFIGLKIAFANTIMEVCHKTGCDVDEVTGALKLAHRRLISPAYMDGGMGDGGGCHPRDNIALSWLARELDLSFDLFEAVMESRERQAEWFADQMAEHTFFGDRRRMGILGTAYKPESHIETGSPALLVKHVLEGRGYEVSTVDFCVKGADDARLLGEPHIWLVGCKHAEWPQVPLAKGSVVIDPFRYIPDQPGVQVVRLGQWAPAHTGTSASTGPRLAA